MTHRFLVLSLLWSIILLASCGPEVDTTQMNVDSQVAAAVSGTTEALPTATAYPTFTPYPTATSYPTATAYPTYTPYPTATLYPTATDEPTATLVPTETVEPTLEPTETAEPTAVSQAPVAPTAAAQPTAVVPTVDTQAQVLAALDSLLHDIDVYVASITAQMNGGGYFGFTLDKTVKCQDLVNAYNHALNVTSVEVTQSPTNVQNAYSTYLAAIPLFQEAAHNWGEVCQAALASGEEKVIGDNELGVINQQMNAIKNMLNGVANELRAQQ